MKITVKYWQSQKTEVSDLREVGPQRSQEGDHEPEEANKWISALAMLLSRNENQNLGFAVPYLHGSHKQSKQELLPAEHGRGKDPGDNSNVGSLSDIQPRHQQEKSLE